MLLRLGTQRLDQLPVRAPERLLDNVVEEIPAVMVDGFARCGLEIDGRGGVVGRRLV